MFSSTNDMDEVQRSVEQIKSQVENLKVVEFKGAGHFCYEDMGTDAFPELLAEFN